MAELRRSEIWSVSQAVHFAPLELAHILLAVIYRHFIPTGF